MNFPASLFRVSIDAEGESKITLVVPAESLAAILPLTKMTGQLLEVDISEGRG